MLQVFLVTARIAWDGDAAAAARVRTAGGASAEVSQPFYAPRFHGQVRLELRLRLWRRREEEISFSSGRGAERRLLLAFKPGSSGRDAAAAAAVAAGAQQRSRNCEGDYGVKTLG